MGNWAGVLPQIKKNHHLNNTVLGGVLLSAVFGALLALPLVTWVTEKYGSGVSLFFGGLALLFLYPLLGINAHISLLVIAVFFLGFSAGWADISMNAQAVVCEKMTRISTLGLFHSLFAIGGLVGALSGGFLLDLGHSVLQITILLSLLMLFPQLFLSWWLYSLQEEKLINSNCFIDNDFTYNQLRGSGTFPSNDKSYLTGNPLLFPAVERDTSHSNPSSSIFRSSFSSTDHEINISRETDSEKALLPSADVLGWQEYAEVDRGRISSDKPVIDYSLLFALSFLCFLSYFGQGSVGDWSAIYLNTDLEANNFECTFGYACFELFVAVGTFLSDSFVMTFGRNLLLQLSGIVSAIGLGIVVSATSVSNHTYSLVIATIGFGICGLGMSVVPPNVISIAGSGASGQNPADAIAWVSSIGYLGMLAGPPLLGAVSQMAGGLRWSFLVDSFVMIIMTLLAVVYQLGNTKRTSSARSNTENTIHQRLASDEIDSQPHLSQNQVGEITC
jgi:MFS family permease